MRKSRTLQLVFQTIYCTLGVVGIVASTGFFEHKFNPVFHVQYTNLSNYFCVFIMFLVLFQTIRKKEDDYVTAVPALKYAGLPAILLTFLVFNLLLAGAPDRDPALNYNIASVLLHVVLPIMYIADGVLFYPRKTMKAVYPLLSTIFPLLYVAFVFIRAKIHNFDPETPLLYPYFFLNIETQGVSGVVLWVFMIFLAFMVIGYVLFALDRILGRRER